MIYKDFASVYDRLMDDVPYDEWSQFLHQTFQRYGNGGNRLLDLACGTGEILCKLAQFGQYNLTGVDLSGEMLAVAHEKMINNGCHAFLVEQDMRDLSGFDKMDAIFINCDSLNYLLTEEDVIRTFQAVFNQLNENGLLVFDVHSVYKVEHVLKNAVFAENDEDVSYIWKCFAGPYPHSVIHELTFFVKDRSGYVRFDEDHLQRTFPVSEYRNMLKKCGFVLIDITTGFFANTSIDQAERLFFVAKKE